MNNSHSSSLSESINYYQEFKELYFEIVKEFHFDHEKDREARDILSETIQEKSRNSPYELENVLKSFKKRIRAKKSIFIYGCGPSLEETVQEILEKQGVEFFVNGINLAADGASLFLKENEIPIDAVFSDLDGITKEIFSHSDFMIIHGHGDNIDKLNAFYDCTSNFQNLVFTTQVEPLENVVNPGGFTDGDRILFFLRTLLIPENVLYLIGMDFKGEIGKYSKPKMNNNQKGSPVKQKKLHRAIKLIEWLVPKISSEMYFVNTERVSTMFKHLSLEEFVNSVLDG